MAKYDPNWMQKANAKKWASQEKQLSHIIDPNDKRQHPGAICGRGWGANGHPSIRVQSFPGLDSLPTCRQCREIFLKSIGVEFDEKTGYPKA